jgi:hypothetical protein
VAQNRIACCCAPDGPGCFGATATAWMSLKFGSGKFGTPWARMHSETATGDLPAVFGADLGAAAPPQATSVAAQAHANAVSHRLRPFIIAAGYTESRVTPR